LRERIDLNIERAKELEPLGDGKAVFLGDMTEDEREDYIKQVDRGWGGFYKKIKNL
jgi:hypothetical protein|tara:strand:+ start:654 stop:821 length:168 start_codon:yes stop_codon:yes gene_type:complete